MRFIIIVDKTYGAKAFSIVDDTTWLIDSAENRAAVNDRRQSELSASPVILFGNPAMSDEDAAIDAFHTIGRRHPTWETIDYLGATPNSTLIARLIMPKGVLSGLYVEQLPDGFRLQKTPPVPRPDRFEVWRRSAPPKGLIKITDRALKRIEELRDHLRQEEPGDWVPSLRWGPSSSKGSKDPDWRALVSEFSVGFFPRQEVPPEIIEHRGEFEIIFSLGLDFKRFAEKQIDYVQGGGFVAD